MNQTHRDTTLFEELSGEVTITDPTHPLFGQTLPLLTVRINRSKTHVTVLLPTGRRRSVPRSATNLERPTEHSGAKGDRARHVSAIRRLLPLPPLVDCERKPVLLGPMRWVDVAGRALRRTWTTHWRCQHTEIISLVECHKRSFPPPRSPRAVRSHYRWSWPERLARNA